MNISTKNRWQVRALAAVVFALGFTTGILAVNVYRGLAHVAPRDRFEQLSQRLQLNADQKQRCNRFWVIRVKNSACCEKSKNRKLRHSTTGRYETAKVLK
jgi:hypothetical protein